jgi:hypothetical protein
MRLNEQEILDNLEVMITRLGLLGQYVDRFPAYALLERYVNRMCTMTPMNQGELFILFKEAYGYGPKSILSIYEDFVATLPTDVEVSITDKEDELWIETEDELVTIEI